MSPKIMLNNEEVECIKVTIIESVERFSQIRLDDGTILNIKATPQEVSRVENRFDQSGNPIYVVKSNNIINVHSSPLTQER
jgi:hypothetical protein